jgi:hypothetical protein
MSMPLIARQAAALHLVNLLPYADRVARFHTHDQLRERGVDQVGDRAGAAAMVRFAPADDAVVGRDLDHDRVAFHGAAYAEGRAVLDRKRGGVGLDLRDFHYAEPPRMNARLL